MSDLYVLLAILLSGAVTWTLRALPFLVLRPLANSAYLAFMGARMPLGIMVILAAYTLEGTAPTLESAGPVALALAVTVGLHVWRHNAIVSIAAGTGVYTVIESAAQTA